MRVLGSLLALFGLLVPEALAGDALLIAPRGDPLPGVPTEVLLVAWGDSLAPVEETPTLQQGGDPLTLKPTETPGVWRAEVVVEPGGATFAAALPDGQQRRLSLPAGELPAESLEGPFVVDGLIGGEPLKLRFSGDDLPEPEELDVAAGEGRVLDVRRTEAGLEVLWEPGPGRQPRAVPIGVRDARRPWTPPTWAIARLRVRARIPFQNSEPGTKVTVEVGGRTYGPEIIGPDGAGEVVADVYPGEWVGESVLEDDLGNQRIYPLPFVQDPRPALALLPGGVIAPGESPPPIFLMAVNETGRPWTGAPPTCRTGVADSVDVVDVGGGGWLVSLPPLEGVFLDVRLDCALGAAAQASTLVPVGTGRPERVGLRVYPSELSADFPYAQIQAWLEDLRGARLPPEGLTLTATQGALSILGESGLTVRGEYAGDAASPLDQIEARWSSEAGEGFAWSLELGAARKGDVTEVQVRALDRLDRPLRGELIAVSLSADASEAPGDATILEGYTDERGWWTGELPALDGPGFIEARSGTAVRRMLSLPWAPPTALDPSAADLSEAVSVTIQAGRVREVFIQAEPSTLYTGSGQTARIQVRLLDQSRLAVTDEEVRITASVGEVGPVRLLADGTREADYSPPQGMMSGRVELIAAGTGESFAASTTLDLAPRPLERSVGLSGGYLTNLGEISAPAASLDLEARLPWLGGAAIGRMSVAFWREQATVLDTVDAREIGFRMDTALLSPGVLYRQEIGVWGVWFGAGFAMAPYQLEVRYGDEPAIRGWGVHAPGVAGFLGTGRRVPGGELAVELRPVGLGGQQASIGYDGQVGGIAFLGGYRVVF